MGSLKTLKISLKLSEREYTMLDHTDELSLVREAHAKRSLFGGDPMIFSNESNIEALIEWSSKGYAVEVAVGEYKFTPKGFRRLEELDYYLDVPKERARKVIFLLETLHKHSNTMTSGVRSFVARNLRKIKNYPLRDPRSHIPTKDTNRLAHIAKKHLKDYKSRLPSLPGGYSIEWEIDRLLKG
jgi:hypothetical protein